MQGAWSERSIGEEIARSHSEVAVAVEEEGGAIAGFSITWRVADEASLLLIAVRERAQRRGIGRRLLRAAERSAQDAGMGTMHLEVRADNRVARAFYSALGYIEVATRAGYYPDGGDAILMSAPLLQLDEVTTVILAGGRGERLGGVLKALLVDDRGLSLLDSIASRFEPAVHSVVIAAPESLRDQLDPRRRFSFVHDRREGPCAALMEAAAALSSEWILLVGVDQPRAGPELLRRLWRERTPSSEAVVVRVGEKREPLGALYKRAALVAHRGVLAPFASLQSLLDRVQVTLVDERELTQQERAALIDVDTLDDVRALGLSVSCAALSPKG
jgi:ribosomal-protein-alanine N-acetyltransferase